MIQNKNFPMNLDLIRERMKKQNLSRKKLAERCQISVSTINKIFRGHSNIRFTAGIRLIKVLGITFDELYSLDK